MSSLNEPRYATEATLKSRWLRGKPGEFFRCAFCGKKFKFGDYYRIIFTNHVKEAFGNPISCKTCDTGKNEEMIEKWKEKWEKWERIKTETIEAGIFWWFIRHEAEQEAIKMEREEALWMKER